MNDHSDEARLWRWAQWLLIWAAVGLGGGRIVSAWKHDAKAPLFSANDRSRWAMVVALIDHGRFEIDDAIRHADGRRKRWHTIDRVQHRGRDGKQHDYSSKPPFLPFLVAMQYAPLKYGGLQLDREPTIVIRLLLLTTNLVPFLIYLLAVRLVINRVTENQLARLFVLTTAGFGTLLSPFLITLNNHLPAAIAVAVTIVFIVEIYSQEKPAWWLFAPAGMFAAFTVANELPALAFFVLTGLALLRRSAAKTLLCFVPVAGVVAVVYFGLNYVAHGTLSPPYMQRHDGREMGRVELAEGLLGEGTLSPYACGQLRPVLGDDVLSGAFCFRADEERFAIQLNKTEERFALIQESPKTVSVRDWQNWYDYPGSYWQTEKTGVDRGESSRAVYAFHALLGHHGIFSLTPVWLFAVFGLGVMCARGGNSLHAAVVITGLSLVVIGFYLARPEIDRNYGGVSCGLRWSFWLIPLWLPPLGVALEKAVRSRTGLVLAMIALAISVGSAGYAGDNPWQHPWLFQFWSTIGWINYG